MSDSAANVVQRLLRRAVEMPTSEMKLEVIEEALRLAHFHQRVDLACQARIKFLEVATVAGYSDKIIAHFAWCLGLLESEPQRHGQHARSLLRKFQYAINNMVDFPGISRGQIHEALGLSAEIGSKNPWWNRENVRIFGRPARPWKCSRPFLGALLAAILRRLCHGPPRAVRTAPAVIGVRRRCCAPLCLDGSLFR